MSLQIMRESISGAFYEQALGSYLNVSFHSVYGVFEKNIVKASILYSSVHSRTVLDNLRRGELKAQKLFRIDLHEQN